MRHGIHAHRAVVGLAECLGLLAELVVRGGHEMIPGEEGQLPLLSECGRLAQREPGAHPGGRAGSGGEELTPGLVSACDRFHPGPPLAVDDRIRGIRAKTATPHLSVSAAMVTLL